LSIGYTQAGGFENRRTRELINGTDLLDNLPSPVSTGIGDDLWGGLPSTQAHSAWPSFREWVQWL